jgi:uncharacterized protein
MEILALTFYPVKSLGGISLQSMEIVEEGPLLDRNWMIVDESGKFVTQREYPNMALIQPEWKNKKLFLHGKKTTHEVPSLNTGFKQVMVWKDTLQAELSDSATNEWISQELGARLFLVKFQQYRKHENLSVRFSDAYPLLVCNQRSLEDLNKRLESPVSIERFRANIVVQANAPWEEDRWDILENESLSLRAEKPCSRCTIITVDPLLGVRGQEPLKTLASFRRFGKNVHFGMNCSVRKTGKLFVGMKLQAGFR